MLSANASEEAKSASKMQIINVNSRMSILEVGLVVRTSRLHALNMARIACDSSDYSRNSDFLIMSIERAPSEVKIY